MLLRLPLEVISNVFRHLIFEDLLNLKTTCHKLNKLITRAILYRDLNLLDPNLEGHGAKYKKTVNAFLQKLIDNKFDGSVVKVLHLDMNSLTDEIASQLSDLFPNITRVIKTRQFMHGYSFNHHTYREYDDDTTPLIEWRNTIEKIDLVQDWDELINDLLNYEYPRLTELTIIETSRIFDVCRKYDDWTLFENAPLLTTLSLYDGNIDLDIFEAIHTGFPLLRSLTLIGMTFSPKENATLPPSIAPANNMMHLELNFSSCFNTNSFFLMYMIIKYPRLEHLVYSINPRADYGIITRDEYQYNDNYVGRPFNIAEFKKAVSLCEETFPIKSAHETMLFSNLPKTMKTLTLKMANKEIAITALAEAGIKVTKIDLIAGHIWDRTCFTIRVKPKLFVEADILKKFKKLTALRILKLPVNLPYKAFTQDTISLSVTKLYIALHGQSTSIESILDMFPSVVELYVVEKKYNFRDSVECEIRGRDDDDYDYTKETQCREVYPKLRILQIERHPIHLGLFPFVNTALPNLNQMKMDIKLPKHEKSKIYKFDLSSYDVHNWNLSFGRANVDCTIIMQNISKRLSLSSDSNTLDSVHQNNTIASQKDLKFVEITVDRITNFKICGFSIVKAGDKILVDYSL